MPPGTATISVIREGHQRFHTKYSTTKNKTTPIHSPAPKSVNARSTLTNVRVKCAWNHPATSRSDAERVADAVEGLAVGAEGFAGGSEEVADGAERVADGAENLADDAEGLADAAQNLANRAEAVAGGGHVREHARNRHDRADAWKG